MANRIQTPINIPPTPFETGEGPRSMNPNLRAAGPAKLNYNPNTGETGLPHPNERWLGSLSPQDTYTLEKLMALDPGQFAAPIAAERNKLTSEQRPLFAAVGIKRDQSGRETGQKVIGYYARHQYGEMAAYAQGRFLRQDGDLITLNKDEDFIGLKAIPNQYAPAYEFILGRNHITPSFAKARERSLGGQKEELTNKTLSVFSSMIEQMAKQGENDGEGRHHLFLANLGENNGTALFTWTEEDSRQVDLLNDRVEIGSLALTEATNDGPMTRQYTLYEGENGPELHRHVWLSDPDFVMPDFPNNPRALRGEEQQKYQHLLAGIIENTYQMDQEMKLGYTAVDNTEARQVISGFQVSSSS